VLEVVPVQGSTPMRPCNPDASSAEIETL
jgi:hypothetical protein